MDGQSSEKELSEDKCVFCGRKLLDEEWRFAKPDAVYCVDCYEEMKL